MRVVCEKSGTREKCAECEHSMPHEFNTGKGCGHGFCYPPLEDELGHKLTQNYKCVEIEEV